MTEIPDQPFDKIAMDLVTDLLNPTGKQTILTIIDRLMGWPEAIPFPNKSADTITKAFIRHYLPRHLCPQFILSDNGRNSRIRPSTESTMDLSIKKIFSAPYHPQVMGNWRHSTNFLNPPQRKCVEDQDNWDDYVEQVLGMYRGVPSLTTGESPFLLVYRRDGNQPLHQLPPTTH